MRSSLRAFAILLLALLLGSCSEDPMGVAIPGGAGAPDSLSVTPLGLHLVLLTWSPVPRVSGYRIERRTGASGEFAKVEDVLSPTTTTYSDASVQPETFYGYRVRGISVHGDAEGSSVVIGVATPPVPGIAVSFQVGTPGEMDANGYLLKISGGDGDTLIQTPVLPTDTRRFSPLRAGTYDVDLSGLSANCTVDGGASRTLLVTDTGVQTLVRLPLQVSCRNPNVGRLQSQITTSGDSLDADGYVLTLTGVASDTALPDDQRAYFRRDSLGVQGSDAFESLRPGDYTLKLTGIAGNCTLNGSATRAFAVHQLDDLRQEFAVTCQGSVDTSLPIVWQSVWAPATAGSGQQTALSVGLDMTAAPSIGIAGAQAILRYDPTVVRLDSARVQDPWQASFNTSTPGQVIWVAFVAGSGVTGNTTFARFYFTAVGATGTTTTTATTISAIADGSGSNVVSQARKVEGKFTVGQGGGGSNQPPVARTGGPYSGAAGTPITFSGASSSDPDGSIATYAWTFGDGATGTGTNPTHTYAAAGSYPVGLTVSDNMGATNLATTTATITGGGGGSNQPPVARAGGPYSGVAGSPMQFDGSASSDPDGSISTFAWTFGDGASGTGSAPVHSYAAAGSYTVTLTVTDNGGATAQSSTVATVAGGTSHPFTWQSAFGPVNPADSTVALTITLDLSTNIAETPGPEALQSWSVDSLQWDPAVLRYSSFNFGAGGGSVNPTDALARGTLVFNGTQSPSANSGVVPIATIRFKVIGAPGSSSQTRTALGALLGTAATGTFSYGSRTAVVEGGVQAP